MTRDTEPAGTREWSNMTEWVVESVSDKPVGFVFDLGPRDYGPAEEEEGLEAVCAATYPPSSIESRAVGLGPFRRFLASERQVTEPSSSRFWDDSTGI